MANGATTETVESAYLNEIAASTTHDAEGPRTEDTNASEMLPGIAETAAEDTEMQGAS